METKRKFNISPVYFDKVGSLQVTGGHEYYTEQFSNMFAVKIRYELFISLFLATYPAHSILLHLNILNTH